MATRGSYVHGRIFGGIPKMLVLGNFLRKWMVSDKKIHRASIELIQLYKQNPLEKLFIFTIYQNYTLALSEYVMGINPNESDRVENIGRLDLKVNRNSFMRSLFVKNS